MDHLDYQILGLLRKNGRETASTISKEIHLSVSAVLDRIKKLEECGVIEQYTIIIGDKAMGQNVMAHMEVSLEHPKYQEKFIQEICANPNVVSCCCVTGEFDFALQLTCRDSEELEAVYRRIKEIPGVWNTRTRYVLREVKNTYSALLPQVKWDIEREEE